MVNTTWFVFDHEVYPNHDELDGSPASGTAPARVVIDATIEHDRSARCAFRRGLFAEIYLSRVQTMINPLR
jgi:hypothetical protein